VVVTDRGLDLGDGTDLTGLVGIADDGYACRVPGQIESAAI
jgi:hypothetical protein